MTIQQYVFKRGKNLVGIGKFLLVLKYRLMQKKTCQNEEVAKSIKVPRKR